LFASGDAKDNVIVNTPYNSFYQQNSKNAKIKNPNQIEIVQTTLELKFKIKNKYPTLLPYIQFKITIELHASTSNINKT
jgi:hypothetical protein